jgi:ferric-dicitrate binding protein FerR (iron transport regulator)
MQQKDFHDILKRYLAGKASPDDEKIIDSWYQAMGKGPQSVLSDQEESDLESRYWSTISRHVKRTKITPQAISLPEKRRGRVVLWYASGIAASLLLFLASYIYLDGTKAFVEQHVVPGVETPTWTQIVNTEKTTKRFTLPDGSHVTFEPQSRLKYSSLFNQNTRDVYFEGDALFEVQRNEQRPFVVHTGEVTTMVLGTSFRVRALDKDKDITVAVRTGRVAVNAHPEDKKARDAKPAEVILTANQQVIYDRYEKTILRKLVEVPLPILPAEKVKLMRFEEGPVAEIFDAIEQVYGVEIVFDKERFASCALTTSISDGGLYNRLDIICKAIGAEYSLHEDHVEIKGTGCN